MGPNVEGLPHVLLQSNELNEDLAHTVKVESDPDLTQQMMVKFVPKFSKNGNP